MLSLALHPGRSGFRPTVIRVRITKSAIAHDDQRDSRFQRPHAAIVPDVPPDVFYRAPGTLDAVVVDALIGIGRAPASAGPRRLAPLRARPALGVSVGEQQSHYCDTEQNKTDRAHGSSPSPCFHAANAKDEAASPPSKPMNSPSLHLDPKKDMPSIAGRSRASQQKRTAHVRLGSKPVVLRSSTRFPLRPKTQHLRVNE